LSINQFGLVPKANVRDPNAVRENLRVLVAEDDRVSRAILKLNLEKWGYEVVVCTDGLQAWGELQKPEAPRLAILDWMMPGMDGIQVCRAIRGQTQQPYVYILLLTAKSLKEDLLTGLNAGADDYLTKPMDPQELELRLRAGRRILDLQSELMAAREGLRIQATQDSLTGVWNRRAVLETLQSEVVRAVRQHVPLGVILADLDGFKSINDVHGHAAGDTVLREAASRMLAALRPYDCLGQYGGEEFLIVAPGCGLDDVVGVAERLRLALLDEPVPTRSGPVEISASFGVISSAQFNHVDAEAFIQAADEAMYQAKASGRNCVQAARCVSGLAGSTPVATSLPPTGSACIAERQG
jgi:two-component system cell cycle response regulator